MRLSQQVKLSPEQLESFGRELDELEQRTRAKLGAEDAAYIRRVIKLSRNMEISGRALLFASLFPPAWLAGTALVGLAKILDNMEIGHNVMHGQYDFMNDPVINTSYEWDTVCPGDQWRHSHNFVHHTYTNVLGLDHDIGYRVNRMSEHQPWHPKWLSNLPNVLMLATLFEWGVGVHDSNIADAYMESDMSKLKREKILPLAKKVARQVLKDYVLFPVLAGPMAPAVAAGNFVANLMRNYWAWAVIYCGHFPEGTAVFTEDQLKDETRGAWYLRQLLGSVNIQGGKTMHLMTGHLSHQIEHHLFPTIPAWRYPEMAVEVQAICKRYGVPYHAGGSFFRQVGQVLTRAARLSLPSSLDDVLNWRKADKAYIHMKDLGEEVLQGKRKPGAEPLLPAPAKLQAERSAAKQSAGKFERAVA
jgi:NADPH-dependent stearoyl-CoA 9-desaturase